MLQATNLTTLETEMVVAMQALINRAGIVLEKVCTHLIPPLKWSSWELNDNIPPLHEIQSWYSTLMDKVQGLSNELRASVQQCDMTGVCESWKTTAVATVSLVRH